MSDGPETDESDPSFNSQGDEAIRTKCSRGKVKPRPCCFLGFVGEQEMQMTVDLLSHFYVIVIISV